MIVILASSARAEGRVRAAGDGATATATLELGVLPPRPRQLPTLRVYGEGSRGFAVPYHKSGHSTLKECNMVCPEQHPFVFLDVTEDNQ